MSGGTGRGGRGGWPVELLRRMREVLEDLAASAHRGAGRAAARAEAQARRALERWAPVRHRVAGAWSRAWAHARSGTRTALSALRHHLLPWLGRVLDRASAAATKGGRRVDPFLRRTGRALHRAAPTWRQALVLLVLVLGVGWILWERCGLAECPDVDRLSSYQPGGASVLLDRDGEKFADLAPMEHEVVPLDSLPPYVADAFIAVEDRRFYRHNGVDWLRVLGAAWTDLRARRLAEGSSTIPMQLARTLFPERIPREEKTFRRKLLEARVAGEIEERYTKHEILELYLNHVYLGGGSYGIQSASRYYFGKEARALELDEAAMLAALPRAPSHYDPRRHPEAARIRRDLVLTLMERQDLVPFADAESARSSELGVAAEPDRDLDGDRIAPYFVQHVRGLLEDELGEALYARPLRIFTTLDVRAQEEAEAALESRLRLVEGGTFGRFAGRAYGSGGSSGGAPGYLQGAVVMLDVEGGEVRAWVGGRDYDDSRYDRARLARRQAGSAFKPFVYGAALEARFQPSQPILDAPYRLARAGGRDWEPRNYSGGFEGLMSMREALVRSQNVPAVRLAAAVGEERLRSLVRRAGIPAEVPASPVAALGVTTVSPLEMAVAYASFAGRGARPMPRFVLRVEDPEGQVLLETQPERVDVTDAVTAFMLTDMLRDVVDRGTGFGVRQAGFRGPAAGKTGTASDATDVWFVGYTPELVAAVWVGFDEVRPLPYRSTGGGIAAPVWGRIMARAYRDRTAPRWEQIVDGVVSLQVDPETGLALAEDCYPRWDSPRWELFREGHEPPTVCPRRARRSFWEQVGGWFDSTSGSRAGPRIPGEPDPDLGVPRLPRRGDAATAARSDRSSAGRGRGVW